MDKDINLSRELKTVFDLAKEDAVKNFLTEISAESIIYYIFKRYIKDSDVLEITYFETFLNKYFTDSERQELLDDCFYCYQASMKNTQYKLDISLYNTSNVSLSSEVLEIFYRAKAAHKFSESTAGISKDCIDCIEFILSSMNSSYISTVRILTTKYGFYKKLGGYLTNMNPDNNKSSNDEGKMMEDLFSGILRSFSDSPQPKSKEKPDKESEENKPNQEEYDSSKDEEFEKAGENEAINAMANTVDPNSKTPNLDQYSIELTKKAKNGEYDPVIGREKEIQEIIEVLCCRKKNNVIITGCAGGGKSAIVEKLAQKIADNDVPRELRGRRIFSLDLNALVSGTQYRGQYEERLQNIIKEVIAEKNLIIFIDEVHNMLGNGSSAGSGDMANILKPYLARGEFQLIGATTEDEFRKFIEKDGALKRRLTQVRISEPNLDETFEILKGISKQYSDFHRVSYTDPVLKRCVEWSDKYINDRFQPDKAIGIMDMSSSVTKLNNPIDLSKVDGLTKKLEEVKNKKIEAVNDARYEEASKYRDEEKLIEEELKKESEKLESSDTSTWPEVKEDDVANVISKISGVPVDKIRSTDMEKIKELKTNLKSKIIGQDEAVDKMVLALQRNILGLRDPKKPIYSALLLGSTGTGKALVNGTPVLTDTGWTNIEDIKVGDLVATPYNGFSKVSGVYPQGKKNTIYRITFKDGRIIDTDENHLWQVRTEKQQRLFRTSSGSNTRNSIVLSTKELYEQLKDSSKASNRKSFKFGIPLHEVYNDEKNLEIPPYVLGVLLGDGCLTTVKSRKTTIIISSDEEDIIKRCADLLKCNYTMHGSKNYSNTLKGDSIIKVNEFLINVGLDCVSKDKYIPENYLMGSIEQRRELLSGLIDTDGYIDNKGRYTFSTTSSKLRDNIIELCRSLGYVATVVIDSRVGKGTAYNIHIWTHDKIFNSEKRTLQYNNIKKGNRSFWNDRLPIVNIEKIDGVDVETTCISIEDKDKLFITKDYIVTHNTLTAKLIAEQFFGSEKNLELISGSEYSEAWAESKLLGSAPGYVGFSDTEPRLYILRRKPYCCLLVDEFEKFDKKLHQLWLNMLEEGEITLSSGEKVSCRNCIILFTSNCGTKSLELKGSGIGFTEPDKDGKRKLDVDTVMREVKKEFRPEFLNRLSSIIVYNSLGKEEMDKIFDIEFKKLQDRLKENYNLTVTESVKNLVVDNCDPKYGARDLQRNITKYIEEEICKAMLEEDTTGKKDINVDYKDEKVMVEFK